MDIFDYWKGRKAISSNVLAEEQNGPSDHRGTFMHLKTTMTTQIHIQWDILFLEQYVKDSMIPRSLGWNVFPEKNDEELGELL